MVPEWKTAAGYGEETAQSSIDPSLHQPNPAMLAKGYNANDQSRNKQPRG